MVRNDKEMVKMQDEFVRQYGHIWRLFTRLVDDFDEEAWMRTGRGVITPVRLSFHILKATKYYIEDLSETRFVSGKPFDNDVESANEEDLPSKEDILRCIDYFSEETEKWLTHLNYLSPNETFPWAGQTQLGVALFLLKHSVYHLGELSSLLNESKHGDAVDNFVKAVADN